MSQWTDTNRAAVRSARRRLSADERKRQDEALASSLANTIDTSKAGGHDLVALVLRMQRETEWNARKIQHPCWKLEKRLQVGVYPGVSKNQYASFVFLKGCELERTGADTFQLRNAQGYLALKITGSRVTVTRRKFGDAERVKPHPQVRLPSKLV